MTNFAQGLWQGLWQRFTNVSCIRIYHGKKRRDSFDPQRENLLGEDSICMVNLLEIPRVIFFFIFLFFNYIIELLRLFQKRSFVLSSKHENQNVATIGTLLDQLRLRCKKERLARFSQYLPRT